MSPRLSARVVISVAALPAPGSVMQIAGLSPDKTRSAASLRCAGLPYLRMAPMAPMLVSTTMRAEAPQCLAISSDYQRRLEIAEPRSAELLRNGHAEHA